MKKERKETLLSRFPAIPYQYQEHFKKSRGNTANFCVLLAGCGKELFVRCYHRFYDGHTEERQRYVFAEDGCVRYRINPNTKKWISATFKEPVFDWSFGWNHDPTYYVIGMENLKDTCMQYSGVEFFKEGNFFEYLKFWQRHKNAEYLVKCGYGYIIARGQKSAYYSEIAWKENSLLKMLHLNRAEFKSLQGHEKYWLEFTRFRTILPNYPPDEIVFFAEYFTDWCVSYIEIGRVLDKTGLNIRQLYHYLQNGVRFSDYEDYIRECEQLDYDLHDSMINRPKQFLTMHERTASILKIETAIHAKREFDTHVKEREILEFQSETLLIRQPENMGEIISEGKALHHCVGGYAERHAMGKLHILFIRQRDKPEIPFYTMEINTNGTIVQVRGSHNCDPIPEVSAFVKEYQFYLQSIFSKKSAAQNAA